MNATQTGTHTGPAGDPRSGDPRIGWSATDTTPHPPSGTAATASSPPSPPPSPSAAPPSPAPPPAATHPRAAPLVQDFLDTLTSDQRDRFTGRCAETILISRHIATADAARSKRAARKPMTNGEARKALKHAKLTTRRIREDGDPLHGSYAAPCRACTALTAHFGVRTVDPAATDR